MKYILVAIMACLVFLTFRHEQQISNQMKRVYELEAELQRMKIRRQITSGANSPAISSDGDVTLKYGDKEK